MKQELAEFFQFDSIRIFFMNMSSTHPGAGRATLPASLPFCLIEVLF
jgi:hypothetical protein